MLVTVWEPVIRNQCATTEAVARNANLNLTSSDVTHVMLTILHVCLLLCIYWYKEFVTDRCSYNSVHCIQSHTYILTLN